MNQGTKRIAAAGGVSILLASAVMVGDVREREGREYTPYKDIVGVVTVCDGITGPDVIPGKVYTDAECNALTIKHVEAHGERLLSCIKVRITQDLYESLNSWTYNVGVGAACGSTLMRLLNQGQYRAACDQLLRWNRAGGREVRGLTLRRKAEREQCVKGIPPSEKATA